MYQAKISETFINNEDNFSREKFPQLGFNCFHFAKYCVQTSYENCVPDLNGCTFEIKGKRLLKPSDRVIEFGMPFPSLLNTRSAITDILLLQLLKKEK